MGGGLAIGDAVLRASGVGAGSENLAPGPSYIVLAEHLNFGVYPGLLQRQAFRFFQLRSQVCEAALSVEGQGQRQRQDQYKFEEGRRLSFGLMKGGSRVKSG